MTPVLEVEYGATTPEFAFSLPHERFPAVPEPPPGPGWEFLTAVALEGRVVWYWRRQSPPARSPHSP